MDIVSRAVLFVTQDMGIPRDLLAKSLSEYTRKRRRDNDIFWTSWRFLPVILERSLEGENVTENKAVLSDMLALLLRKGLVIFGGVEPVTELFAIPGFYLVTTSQYSWPDIPESLHIDFLYEVAR